MLQLGSCCLSCMVVYELPAQLGSRAAVAGQHYHPFPPLSLQAITTCVNFIFSFVIGQVYLTMLCKLEFGTYIFFAFWVLVMTIYAMFFLPETKGVPIEEMGFAWRWASSPYITGPCSLAVPFQFCAHELLICKASIIVDPTTHICASCPSNGHLVLPLHCSCKGRSLQHFHVIYLPACCISSPGSLPVHCRRHWFWSRIIMSPEERAAFRKGDLIGAGMGATELTGGKPVVSSVANPKLGAVPASPAGAAAADPKLPGSDAHPTGPII